MNAKRLTLAALLSALTLMSGCSGSSSATDVQQSTEPEVIHGYTLPPEPDQTINNSTLLGIDSNDNGVWVKCFVFHCRYQEKVKQC